MLQFDGNSWKVFHMHNQLDVRSVLASKSRKKIYVGGINEFGYYVPDNDGKLRYTCMSDSLTEDIHSIGNIWGIHENDNIMYFQGDHSILKYLNGKYTQIDINTKIDCSYMINGILYLGTSSGVMVLVGNSFFPLVGSDILNSKRIRNILPYKKGLLIVTAYNGLYYYKEKKVVPLPTKLDDFLHENEVFCAAIYGSKIALGTIHNGVVLADLNTKKVKYFNENNGLQNQTVLSVNFDSVGNMWVGMDSGIDLICLNSPLSTLYSSPHSLGVGYTAMINGNLLYLGTNRGLYVTSYPVQLGENSSLFYQIPNSSGQVWKLSRVGKDIFCSHDRGLFLLENKKLKKIGNIQGVWICKGVYGRDNMAYVGTYDGLFLMKKENGIWNIKNRIDGFSYSFRNFTQETAGILWLVEGHNVIKIVLDEKLSKVVSLKSYDKNNGLPFGKFYTTKIDSIVYFMTEKGVYKHDNKTDSMVLANNINMLLDGKKKYDVLNKYKNNLVGLTHDEICISNSLQVYKGSERAKVLSVDMSDIELVGNAEDFIMSSDSTIIIPNDNGFALLNTSFKNIKKESTRFMFIRNVYLTSIKDSLI